MPSEKNANTCIYRYTRQTILLDSEKNLIPPEGIPNEGLCWVRRDSRGLLLTGCEYLFSKSCHKSQNSDFCDEPWAQNLTSDYSKP